MIPMLSAEEAQKRFNEWRVADVEEVPIPALAPSQAPTNVFRLFLNNPAVAFGFFGLSRALVGSKTLDHRIRELVVLRTNWRTKSEYPFVKHVALCSQHLKMTDEEILGVRDPAKCKAYNDTDRAVIAMADELHDHAKVSPKTWATLEKSFSVAELVELIIAAGFWRMGAALLNTAELPFEPTDTARWPEGKAPA